MDNPFSDEYLHKLNLFTISNRMMVEISTIILQLTNDLFNIRDSVDTIPL